MNQDERHPFWGYSDLGLFIGLALPCMVGGMMVVKVFLWSLNLQVRQRVFELLPAQFLGYAFLFLLLWLLFRRQHGRPFWSSLGWTETRLRPSVLLGAGVATALAVALASLALKTPDISSPMKEFLSSRSSVVMLAIFGTTLGPLCEELAFRGLMQPLFTRTFGPIPGILLAALPFGLLHLQQYGWSWRHGLLITAAGAAFGWMRHRTGSTKASTIMHMAYNCTFFLALVAQRDQIPKNW